MFNFALVAAAVKPATITPSPAFTVMSDPEFSAWAAARLAEIEFRDEPRPTAGPDFIPTPEEMEEAAGLLRDDDPRWDARASAALALDLFCSGNLPF